MSKKVSMGLGIAVGLTFGISIGTALDNWGVGIALGVAMFLIFSSMDTQRKEK